MQRKPLWKFAIAFVATWLIGGVLLNGFFEIVDPYGQLPYNFRPSWTFHVDPYGEPVNRDSWGYLIALPVIALAVAIEAAGWLHWRPLLAAVRLLRRNWWVSAALCALLVGQAWYFWPRITIALPKNAEVIAIRGPQNPVVERVEELLSQEDPGPFPPFDISYDGVPVVGVDGILWAVGPGLIKRVLKLPDNFALFDFAWMDDGALLLTGKASDGKTNGYYVLGEKGVAPFGPSADRPNVRPAGGMGAYIYDAKTSNVFMLRPGGQVANLASFPTTVEAVAGDGKRTFIGTGKRIYATTFGASPSLYFEAKCEVVSLAVDPSVGVFYSTKCAVGFIDGKQHSYEFVRGAGGIIRLRGSALYLLMKYVPRVRLNNELLIYRFEPISAFKL